MVTNRRQQRLERSLREGLVAVVGLSHRATYYLYYGDDGYYLVTHDECGEEFEGPRRVSVWRRGRLFDEEFSLVEPGDVPGPVAALSRSG
jgi:hypothetical protein